MRGCFESIHDRHTCDSKAEHSHAADSTRHRLIHRLARCRPHSVQLRVLLQLRADPLATDGTSEGWTALHEAAAMGCVQV